MRVETSKSLKRAETPKFDPLADLVQMAEYYEARFKVTHDVLYEYCIGVVLRAIEKLDGGADRVATESAAVRRVDVPAVQPSTSQILLQMLDSTPRPIDGLIFASGKEAQEVSSALLMLELAGRVKKLPGNRYIRK